MTTFEERSLEFNMVSAYDLKKVTTFGKQNCFVVAYVNPSQKKSTKVDYTGGRNPVWNSKLVVTCDEKLLCKPGSYCTVEVYSNGAITNKLVGTVTIPLNEVGRNGKLGSTKPQVLSYQVRRRSGKIQGTLNLSVKLGEKKTISTLPAPRCYGKQHSGQAHYGLPAYAFQPHYGFGSQYQYYGSASAAEQYGYASPQWRSTAQF